MSWLGVGYCFYSRVVEALTEGVAMFSDLQVRAVQVTLDKLFQNTGRFEPRLMDSTLVGLHNESRMLFFVRQHQIWASLDSRQCHVQPLDQTTVQAKSQWSHN